MGSYGWRKGPTKKTKPLKLALTTCSILSMLPHSLVMGLGFRVMVAMIAFQGIGECSTLDAMMIGTPAALAALDCKHPLYCNDTTLSFTNDEAMPFLT